MDQQSFLDLDNIERRCADKGGGFELGNNFEDRIWVSVGVNRDALVCLAEQRFTDLARDLATALSIDGSAAQ